MKSKFEYYLDKFPVVELPITLTEDMYVEFNKHNDMLKNEFIKEFIHAYEPNDPEDYTEVVPCLKLKKKDDIHYLVYWRADLLNYSFIFASYNKAGKMVDKKAIAGLEVRGNKIYRTAAVINDDYSVVCVEGVENADKTFDAEASVSRRYETTSAGLIEQLYYINF